MGGSGQTTISAAGRGRTQRIVPRSDAAIAVVTPDAQIWIDAGVIAGALARTQKFQPHQRRACRNDALIVLAAAKAGVPF